MEEMTLNQYQKEAMVTCMDTCRNISYMLINLVGETGEFSSKVSKAIRKGNAEIVNNHLVPLVGSDKWNEIEQELKLEAGDIAWQLSGLCSVMGWKLDDICKMNIDKLASRKKRGVIDGNGDFR